MTGGIDARSGLLSQLKVRPHVSAIRYHELRHQFGDQSFICAVEPRNRMVQFLASAIQSGST
jgi:hypothetical protein